MDSSKFIDLVAAGQASEAKETLSTLLSAIAVESLDVKKIELAQTMFQNSDSSEEFTTDEISTELE